MEINIGSRLKHAFNAFMNRDPTYKPTGSSYSSRPDRPRLSRGNERSIITSIFNRIALDVAGIDIKHCRLDENNRYIEDIKSNLNECLSTEANIDQTGRAFIQDVVMSMLDEGCVAIVPVDTTINPKITSSYDILSMRTGKILDWYPEHVRVRVYNDKTGEKEDILLPKKQVGIIENPLYAVVNEHNSTMQRLKRKLALLDVTDEQTASGKLDLIIQLPYVVKTEARREQANRRRQDLEEQLAGSKYGIAYADGSFKLTGKNSSFDFNTVTGELNIEASSLKISSKSVATKDDVDEVRDEITTLMTLNSTRGVTFKNNKVSTVLYITIYHGKQRITEAATMKEVYGENAYLQWKWLRLDEAEYGIISSSDSRFRDDGFKFVLSPDDVDAQVSFECELITDE